MKKINPKDIINDISEILNESYNIDGSDSEIPQDDILKKDTQTQEFLSLNPNGKIPVLVLEDGRVLSESNAILGYLAEGTKFIPIDPYIK